MKELLRLVTFILSFFSFSAYSLGDLVFSGGYSTYKFDSSNQDNSSSYPNPTGYNAGVNFYLKVIGFNPGVSLILGPKLKYETVNSTLGNNKLTFTTTQFGGEGGLKIRLVPRMTFYGTGFYTYGFSNSFTSETNGVSTDLSVSKAYQSGGSAKIIFSTTPIIGIGFAFDYVSGSFDYDAIPVGGAANVTDKYTGQRYNGVISIRL